MRTAVNCLLIFLSFSAHAAIIGNSDNRMSYPEYADYKFPKSPEAMNAYSAAGRLNCPSFWGSGTLVLRNDILVFAGHAAMEKDRKGRCVRRAELPNCVFQSIRYDGSLGRPLKIDVSSLKVSKNFRCEGTEFDNDWAVARLRSPYSEIVPFELWDAEKQPLQAQTKVTVFSAISDNFRLTGKPTICEGKVGYIWRMNSGPTPKESYGLGTNCSGGEGGSGGAVTVIGGDFVRFVGLISMTKDKSFDGLPFDNNNFTGGPYIKNELQSAILSE